MCRQKYSIEHAFPVLVSNTQGFTQKTNFLFLSRDKLEQTQTAALVCVLGYTWTLVRYFSKIVQLFVLRILDYSSPL